MMAHIPDRRATGLMSPDMMAYIWMSSWRSVRTGWHCRRTSGFRRRCGFRCSRNWRQAFFVVYVAVTALSLPGAAIMTLAGGAVFGLLWGTVLVSFASSIGATLAFLASRFLLRDWVQARFGERLRAINAGVEKEGGFYLFTLRLVPVFPFFMINLLMGLTPMRAWTFYWVSQVGMLAGTMVYVNAGTQLAGIDSACAASSRRG
jgi:uncharacterized membrane protein YdjX (TVP38/TMEM64 family)